MSLCGLPAEILIQIINDESLSPLDLYSVATLSRSLHYIALPTLLKEYDMQDPSEHSIISVSIPNIGPNSATNQPVLDGLSVLAISTDIKTINFAQCKIYGFVESNENLERLEFKIQQLLRFLSRLKRISHFYMDFKEPVFPQNGHGSALSNRTVELLIDSLGSVLNAAILCGCTDIALSQQRWFPDARGLDTLSQIPTIKSSVKKVVHHTGIYLTSLFGARKPSLFCFRGPTCKSCLGHNQITDVSGRTKSEMVQISLKSIKASNLHSISIHSWEFFAPPCISWTQGILHHSPALTTVSLGASMDNRRWELALLSIVGSMGHRLKRISFKRYCFGLSLVTLLEFLSTVPHLTHLEVHIQSLSFSEPRLGDSLDHPCTLPNPRLSHLEVLVAPFAVVNHLLKTPLDRSIPPLPRLKDFTMEVDGVRFHQDYLYVTSCHQMYSTIQQQLSRRQMAKTKIHFALLLSGLIMDHNVGIPVLHDRNFINATESRSTVHFDAVTIAVHCSMGYLYTNREAYADLMNFLFPELVDFRVHNYMLEPLEMVSRMKKDVEVVSVIHAKCPKLERLALLLRDQTETIKTTFYLTKPADKPFTARKSDYRSEITRIPVFFNVSNWDFYAY